jgi:hypothetical protein
MTIRHLRLNRNHGHAVCQLFKKRPAAIRQSILNTGKCVTARPSGQASARAVSSSGRSCLQCPRMSAGRRHCLSRAPAHSVHQPVLVWILTLPFVPSRWGGNIRRQAAVLDFECERQLLADIVAKVENRSAPKIWRKLILGYLRGCVTFQRHWEGPWLILDETIWSPTSAHAKCISALRIFVRHPKKTFATISAQGGRWSPLRADDRSQGGGARLHRQAQTRVCTKNSIRVDDVMESPKLAE